jgi:hypothetical protein
VPPILQFLKNFPEFYETHRFITVFTRALHWSLSYYCSVSKIFLVECVSDSDVICYVIIRNILDFISNVGREAKSAYRSLVQHA